MENLHDKQQLLEEAKREFLIEMDRCESKNATPSLPTFIRRYPSMAAELLAWTTTLMARHQCVARDTEAPQASEHTLAIIDKVTTALRAEPKNLNEAREALGLSQISLAKRLRLSPTVTKGLARGAQNWPSALEEMLASVLVRSRGQVATLLSASAPVPAHSFKAIGDPTSQPYQTKTFRELLEDADRKGELSPEDKRFWIEHLDIEGK